MNRTPFRELVARWREEAEVLGRRHVGANADLLRDVADELEESVRDWEGETLTLTEAAAETGYSRDQLGRLLRDGKIPNAGRQKAPRILRRDLPRKAGAVAHDSPVQHSSRTQIVQSVIAKEGR